MDMILVRPLHTLKMNILGYQNPKNTYINGALMMFEEQNPFIKICLKRFGSHYGTSWTSNGPGLLTRMWRKWQQTLNEGDVHIMPHQYFYMITFHGMLKEGFTQTSGKDFDKNMRILKSEAHAVHLNSKISGRLGVTMKLKRGTIGNLVLNSYCVLCNRLPYR